MNIITLGNCCKKSQKNHENAVVAAKNCGITEPVVNIGDMVTVKVLDVDKMGKISLSMKALENEEPVEE